jgi:hypothetical protein
VQLSVAAQTPLPQPGGHGPQSAGQLVHCSPANGSHTPSPQPPPSTMQVAEQPSPDVLLPSSHCSPGSTVPLPQLGGHGPQSATQLLQSSSGGRHTPSPHGVHMQSFGQLMQFSMGTSHEPSPHIGGHSPQSAGQASHVSPVPHAPSPQQTTQSPGHVSQVSSALHTWSPQPQQKPESSHMQSATPTAHCPGTDVRPHDASARASTAAARARTHVPAEVDGERARCARCMAVASMMPPRSPGRDPMAVRGSTCSSDCIIPASPSQSSQPGAIPRGPDGERASTVRGAFPHRGARSERSGRRDSPEDPTGCFLLPGGTCAESLHRARQRRRGRARAAPAEG